MTLTGEGATLNVHCQSNFGDGREACKGRKENEKGKKKKAKWSSGFLKDRQVGQVAGREVCFQFSTEALLTGTTALFKSLLSIWTFLLLIK